MIEPTRIILLDPVNRKILRVFIFVGAVPHAVSKALDTQDTKILSEYYGQRWREKLHIKSQKIHDYEYFIDGKYTGSAIIGRGYTGSAIIGGSGYTGDSYTTGGDFDDIEFLLSDNSTSPAATTAAKLYTREYEIYPFDRLEHLRNKIYATMGIPTYRQHIFYVQNNHIRNFYMLSAEGLYDIDILELAKPHETLMGAPIDRQLYNMRDSIRVETLENFQTCRDIHTFYVVDLALFTKPHIATLQNSIHDKFMSGMYYYGFVVKFWPQLTEACFQDYIANEANLLVKYPSLMRPLTEIQHENEYMRNIIMGLRSSTNKRTPLQLAITNAQISLQPTAIRGTLSIRNLFENLHVSPKIPEILAITQKNGIYTLRKKYYKNESDIPFPQMLNLKINQLVIAISRYREDQLLNHRRDAHTLLESEIARFVYLIIDHTGVYHIRCTWRDEDNTTFDTSLEYIREICNPVIATINEIGRLAIDGELPLITRTNIQYTSINVNLFWNHIVTETAFRAVKSSLDNFARAGIVIIKNSQISQVDLLYCAGIYEFDNNNIDRIVAAAGAANAIQNQYIYLTDPFVNKKWRQNFIGRACSIILRTTDVQFKITNIRENEYPVYYEFIEYFTYICSQLDSVKRQVLNDTNRKLKKLREQDPELYDLKKHGSTKLYSMLCQQKNQPIIYTEQEFHAMSEKQQKKLVKYWNFTRRHPVYYECNNQYPHLSFIVGVHPRNYCMPCCMKTSDNADNKKTKIREVCLGNRVYNVSTLNSNSRHIINYGKEVEPGRLCRLPTIELKNLLGVDKYLYGVPQNMPAVRNTGLIFAVGDALGIEIGDLCEQIIKWLKTNRSFGSLLSGQIINYFANESELSDAINDLFVRQSNITTSGQQYFEAWNDLFQEIFYGMGYNVYIFAENTKVNVIIPPYLIQRPVSKTNIIVCRTHFNHHYPIYQVDLEEYVKTLEIKSRVFYDVDNIRGMIRKNEDAGPLSLTNLAQKLDIVYKLVNRSYMCYAVITRSGAYIPCDFINPQIVNAGVVNQNFVVGKSCSILLETLNKLGVMPTGVVEYSGQAIALEINHLLAYFEQDDTTLNHLKKRQLPVDYREINKLIVDGASKSSPHTTGLGLAMYTNHSYELFLVEFMNYLRTERDDILRKKIEDLINSTDFKIEANKFISSIRQMVPPVDFVLINGMYQEFINSHSDKKKFIQQIIATRFTFDAKTLERIRSSDSPNVDDIVGKIVTTGRVPDNISFPNVYLPCASRAADYCKNSMLVLSPETVEEYKKILISDIKNELKYKYLSETIFAENAVNYFQFTSYPGEIVLIYHGQRPN